MDTYMIDRELLSSALLRVKRERAAMYRAQMEAAERMRAADLFSMEEQHALGTMTASSKAAAALEHVEAILEDAGVRIAP